MCCIQTKALKKNNLKKYRYAYYIVFLGTQRSSIITSLRDDDDAKRVIVLYLCVFLCIFVYLFLSLHAEKVKINSVVLVRGRSG